MSNIDIDLAWKAGSAHRIQQKESEWKEFISLLNKYDIKSVLEIGCYSGGTTYSFATFAENLISIDINAPLFDTNIANINYSYILGNSAEQSTVDKVSAKLNGSKVDLLFIDGDHGHYGSYKDYELYNGFVRQGGIIAFHDIVDSAYHRGAGCYVSQTWQSIIGNKLEIVHGDDWAGIGVILL